MNEIQKNRIKKLFMKFGVVLRSTRSYKDYTDACNYTELTSLNRDIIVFDVGANIGQTAIKYKHSFPQSRILAFEPFDIPFRQLSKNADFAECHQLALSDVAVGTKKVAASNHPRCKTNSIEKAYDPAAHNRHEENINISTLDNFTQEYGIDSIDILKIDTEGNDLKVLQGAIKNLEAGKINNIVVESCIYAKEKQIELTDFKSYLEPYGFVLYSIYNISHANKDGRTKSVDVLFKKSN